ncbi:MAG: hypothetical protein LBM70_03825 [Victivallales bacterium]|jgi:hypothetical protein|nr:hypothetical protein [Victivallales bacterium]
MFAKILIGIITMFCIGCLGTEDDNTFDSIIAKNTEKFIKHFNFSLDQESAEPFKITPLQILKSPLFDKFELEGYLCEVYKTDGVIYQAVIFKQNERIARCEFRTAATRRDSIRTLGGWMTFSSMPIELLLKNYEVERNKIGEDCFYNKSYNKKSNRFSKKTV